MNNMLKVDKIYKMDCIEGMKQIGESIAPLWGIVNLWATKEEAHEAYLNAMKTCLTK